MATDLCLSVIKYSHAVGVRSDVTIPWVHLQATNLFVIVKGTSVKSPDGQLNPDARLDMRIVRGTEVLVRSSRHPTCLGFGSNTDHMSRRVWTSRPL